MSNAIGRKRHTDSNGHLYTIIGTAAASGAATLIAALVIGWLTVGRWAVGREEVAEMIAAGTPYVAERQALHNSVETNTQRIDRLAEQLREIERQGNRVEAKLDLLLGEFVRDDSPMPKDK